jgi:hypothetical protein
MGTAENFYYTAAAKSVQGRRRGYENRAPADFTVAQEAAVAA